MSLRTARTTAVALVTAATFTDIVAYSIAVPVLPDLSRRLGASPTMIGLLFGSFGVTLLTVSVPMGAVSDRVGRKSPMLTGLVALAASTLLFAYASSLVPLFAARMVQGAADAITWVVGFALVADLYAPEERGRVTGVIMGGTSLAYMLGPSIGGWLYEAGGIRLPFLFVTAMAIVTAVGFAWLRVPPAHADHEPVPIAALIGQPEIRRCAIVVFLIAATITMFEPIFVLYLQGRLALGPARIGTLFAGAALVNAFLHPVVGRSADRWGPKRLTHIGLFAVAAALLLSAQAWSFWSALVLGIVQAATFALVATPSLTYMADSTSRAGVGAFGTAYGFYNMVWGLGLLAGPAAGGFLFERLRFPMLALVWAASLAAATLWLTSSRSASTAPR